MADYDGSSYDGQSFGQTLTGRPYTLKEMEAIDARNHSLQAYWVATASEIGEIPWSVFAVLGVAILIAFRRKLFEWEARFQEARAKARAKVAKQRAMQGKQD